MAKAIVCDMCGGIIKMKKNSTYVNLMIYDIECSDDGPSTATIPHHRENADLCLVCATKVHNYIFNKKENKNA